MKFGARRPLRKKKCYQSPTMDEKNVSFFSKFGYQVKTKRINYLGISKNAVFMIKNTIFSKVFTRTYVFFRIKNQILEFLNAGNWNSILNPPSGYGPAA